MRRVAFAIASSLAACGRLASSDAIDSGDDASEGNDASNGDALVTLDATPPSNDAGTTDYVPCDGCTSTILVSSLTGAMRLAADEANVYWSSSGQLGWAVITKCAIETCVPVILSTKGGNAIVVVGAALYTWNGALVTACTTDCADNAAIVPATLNDSLASFTATDSRLFWSHAHTSSGTIDNCDPTDCEAGTAFTQSPDAPRDMVADQNKLYWINLGSAHTSGIDTVWYDDGGILTCPLSACDGGSALAQHRNNASLLAANTTDVFWVEGGAILRCAKSGCSEQPKTLATFAGEVSDLAVDESALYFVLHNPVDAGDSTWRIVRMKLDGSEPPTAITQDQLFAGPYGFAANSKYVFWVAPNGTEIMETPK